MPIYEFTEEQANVIKNIMWFEQKTHIGWPIFATMQMQENKNGQMASNRAPLPEGTGDQVGVHRGKQNNGQTGPETVPGPDVSGSERSEPVDAPDRLRRR